MPAVTSTSPWERVTECLKLENASLRRDLKRFNNAIREGENLGEPAEAIDLEHMEVLCHQSMKRLRELEVQCLEMKARWLKLNQMLTNEKAEIARLLTFNKQLYSDIERAVATTIRLKNEIARNRQLKLKAHKRIWHRMIKHFG
ncbi:unnamed protein product [Dicrocoelium dendriticum]|nr:unnamed protein product [Dicrocoelium dendriticum]